MVNPVLSGEDVSDHGVGYVADPFMIRSNGVWYMFFEVMNKRNRKGTIGLASSKEGTKWAYQQIVLEEPFHLSYPYVFEWNNDFYMIPESYQSHSIRLYKATRFPTHWLFEHTLIDGDYVDSSIFRFGEKWWLFTGSGQPPKRADTLRLFHADELTGPWLEHPESPIIEGDLSIARPAGRVLVLGKSVVRYTQDCHPTYGTQVRAFEVTDLTAKSYHEREVENTSPVLKGTGTGWNAGGMHHIDPHVTEDGRWIACVDGWKEVEGH